MSTHQDVMIQKILEAVDARQNLTLIHILGTHKLKGAESGATPGLVGVNNESASERRCKMTGS